MKTTILALAAVATLGMAVPAAAQEGAPRAAAIKVSQDFSSSHRHHWRHHGWGWRRHHWDRHCTRFWRHGRLITVCR